MIPASVRHARAASVGEALGLLAEPDAKILAGGQSLLPVMKLRIARPSLLVDIGGLGLRDIEEREDAIRIGALATWDDVVRAEKLRRPGLEAIPECAAAIGDLQVRNRGTIGGSLAHADPASDMPAVLLALGARLEISSPDGTRAIGIDQLFAGPFLTTLGAQELITEVVIPIAPAGSASAYVSVEHPASGFALAGAAALVGPDGNAAVALTGIAATPLVLGAGDVPAALSEIEIFGDRFAPEAYRRELARVVVERALERARARIAEAR